MANLRSKYKAKSVKIGDLKDKADEENSMIGAKGFNDYLEFVDGKAVKFRLFPPHDGVDFYVMKKQCWLTLEDSDGKEVRRTVLNSVLHGGTKLDLIDEYIKFAKANLKDDEKLKILTDWKTGLSYDLEWVAYAVKIVKDVREFGLLAFKKTVRDALNKELFMEDESDPIEVDPFTDIDDGLPLLIKYLSKPNKKKGEEYYSVTVGKKAQPLTDEELEKFDKAKSLIELFRGVYKLSDFERALAGVQHYDTENEFDFFEDDRWLEIVEEVKNQYDEEEEEEEEEEDEKPKKEKKAKKSKKPEPEEDEEEEEEEDDVEEEEDELDGMSRKELLKYIKAEDLEIKVKKSMSDEDIREAIREASEEEEDDIEEEEEDEVEETPKKGKMSIDDIRNRLRKGK